jgi:hypoxanthine-DNA glycosylase
MAKSVCRKKDEYKIESHPFEDFIPENTKHLIIGTFPTNPTNLEFDFFYSGRENLFWNIMENVFNHNFINGNGNQAVEERKHFLESRKIGITDMIKVCYRKNNLSTDENLFPIILNDIFKILQEKKSIETLVLTSRTEVFGALGILKTYFVQKELILNQPPKRVDKILESRFLFENNREIKLLVPYSPSPRLISNGITDLDELVYMYDNCLR